MKNLWLFALLLAVPLCRAQFVASVSGNVDNPATFGGSVPDCVDGGDTVTINAGVTLTVDVNCILGNSPSSGFVLTGLPGSAVALNPGVTLTLRGGFDQGGALIAYGGASGPTILQFDASEASAPMSTNYDWVTGTTASKTAAIQTSGTTATGFFLVMSNSAGGNAYGSLAAGNNTWNVAYTKFLNMGTATLSALVVTQPANVVQTFANFVCNSCGLGSFSTLNSGTAGLSITNSVWENSLATHSIQICDGATATSTATRQILDSAFDVPPLFDNGNCVIENDYFDHTWNMGGAGDGESTFEYNLSRNPNGNQPGQLPGTESYNYYLTDYWPAPAVTSTATSATATTLTDDSLTYTSGAYNSTTANGWEVLTTGGTGANQLAKIISNNTHTLTISPAWATIPDPTTTYWILDGVGNVHMLAANSGTHTGDIGDCTNVYGTGKVFLNSNLGAPITLENNITLPGPSGVNCAALFDFGMSAVHAVTATHNTIYTGGFVGAYVDDYLDTGAAGYIAEDANSIFWTYATNVSSSQCGSVVIEDNQHCTSGGVLNYGLPSAFNYNAKWNLNNGTYLGNGYSINESAQPGANDIDLPADDGPGFVDPTRNWITWCESLGITGLLPQVSSQCRAALLNANDFTNGGNPAFNPSALYEWVQAGFAPTNTLLCDAASDGTTIGAITCQQ